MTLPKTTPSTTTLHTMTLPKMAVSTISHFVEHCGDFFDLRSMVPALASISNYSSSTPLFTISGSLGQLLLLATLSKENSRRRIWRFCYTRDEQVDPVL